jgi:hypothetical protein
MKLCQLEDLDDLELKKFLGGITPTLKKRLNHGKTLIMPKISIEYLSNLLLKKLF